MREGSRARYRGLLGVTNYEAMDLPMGILLCRMPRVSVEWQQSGRLDDREVKRYTKAVALVPPTPTRVFCADRRMNSGHFTGACSGPLPERLDLVFRKTSHELISIFVDIDNCVRPAGAFVRREVYSVRRKHDTDAWKLT